MVTPQHKSLSLRRAALAAALALAPAALLVAAAPAAAQASAAPIQQAVAALRKISTMRADFVQTDRQGRTVTGTVTLKQPGKIRFQYQKGVPLLIVSDGKALTFVDYEVRQVQRWPLKNSPLGALLDPTRDVARYGTVVPTQSPNVVSVAVRDRQHPEYGAITLIFVRKPTAPGGLELTHWVSLDAQSKRTTVRLSNHRYGEPVGDNAFRFTDPRGTSPRR